MAVKPISSAMYKEEPAEEVARVFHYILTEVNIANDVDVKRTDWYAIPEKTRVIMIHAAAILFDYVIAMIEERMAENKMTEARMRKQLIIALKDLGKFKETSFTKSIQENLIKLKQRTEDK